MKWNMKWYISLKKLGENRIWSFSQNSLPIFNHGKNGKFENISSGFYYLVNHKPIKYLLVDLILFLDFRFHAEVAHCQKRLPQRIVKKSPYIFTKYFYFQHSIWTLHSTSNKSTIHFSKIFISVALGCFLLLVKDSHTYSSIKRRIPIWVILKKGYLILADWYSRNWHSGKCCFGNMLFWQISSRHM